MINSVARWRKFEGMTQAELADACDCRRETIGNLEIGRYKPSLELALAIATALNRPVETLFSLEEEEPPEFGWVRPTIEPTIER